ncbi:MAG: MBL fold metallo-hydrolase [archaeon]|nr:MBL fold metallo-hydrolase [archaeon]
MSLEVHILASGSSGNCTVVKTEDRAIMVDAGLSHKKIQSLMNVNGIDSNEIEALLITHEHSDHVEGAGVIARKLGIPIYCNQRTFDASPCIGKVVHNPTTMMSTFSVAGMDVLALPTSHDAAEPCAYFVKCSDKKVLIATDTGKITNPIEQALKEANIAIIESNYDKKMLDNGPYPIFLKKLISSDLGHMSNVACAQAVKRTMCSGINRKIFLGHLSRYNNTPDTAKDTISAITGIKRFYFDCLECQGDTRILKL